MSLFTLRISNVEASTTLYDDNVNNVTAPYVCMRCCDVTESSTAMFEVYLMWTKSALKCTDLHPFSCHCYSQTEYFDGCKFHTQHFVFIRKFTMLRCGNSIPPTWRRQLL